MSSVSPFKLPTHEVLPAALPHRIESSPPKSDFFQGDFDSGWSEDLLFAGKKNQPSLYLGILGQSPIGI